MARLTKEEYDALRSKYGITSPSVFDAGSPPTLAPAPAAPAPSEQRAQTRTSEEMLKSASAAQEAQKAAAEARRADIAKQRAAAPETFEQDVAQRAAEAKIKEQSPPIYAGGWQLGTTTPLFGTIGAAPPMNVAVPPSEAPDLATAMRPQTILDVSRANQDANRIGQVFDDQAFMSSIKDLPSDKRQIQLDSYAAFKNGFAKLRHDNPLETGVTDAEIVSELKRQINEYAQGKAPQMIQKPAEQLSGGLGAALQKQVTEAKIPMMGSGALAFFDELNKRSTSAGEEAAATRAEDELKKKGVPVMEPVRGNREGLERQVGTRPPTDADISAAQKDARALYKKQHPVAMWETADRDSILSNIENNATGGTLFEKQYPTGATVESSLSHAMRSVFALPNYIAGATSDLFTPEDVQARERAARPQMYRDASSAVYNVAQARGFMGEIQDLYRYSPVKMIRDNEWIGNLAGFAADMLSLEAAAAGSAASGARAAIGAARAGESAAGIAELSGRGAASEFARSIGLPSVSKAIAGDIRLKAASKVADDFIATARYEDAISSGASHTDAVRAAESVAPNSRAVEQMKFAGSSFDPATFMKDNAAEYKQFKDVDNAVKAASVGKSDDTLLLRPYLKAAASDPAVKDAIIAASGAGKPVGKYSTKMKINDVVDAIKSAGSLDRISDAAAFDKAFLSVDRAVGVLEPGKSVIAITPRTFGTERGARAVVSALAESPSANVIADIEKSGAKKIPVRIGGQKSMETVYELTGDQVTNVRNVIAHEVNTGTIPSSAAKKAMDEIRKGVISSDSLREIRYSIADGIATEIQSSKRGETFSASALVPTTTKVINYGSQSGTIKLKIEQVAKSISDRLGTSSQNLNKLNLSTAQISAINEGKSAMSEIDKTLKSEFTSLEDAETASHYGVSPDSTVSQKMAAITLGMEPDLYSTKETLYNWLRSTIFGTDNVASSRFLGDFIPGAPGFAYESFDDVFNTLGRSEIEEIVDKYARIITTPDKMLSELPNMTNEVMNLTTKMEEAGGKVSNKPMYLNSTYSGKKPAAIFKLGAKPEEAMIGTYARNKGDIIFQNTMSNVLQFDPLTTSPIGQLIKNNAKDVPYDELLQIGVAHQLKGNAPLTSLDELMKIPGARRLDQKFFELNGNRTLHIKDVQRMSSIIEDIKGTAAAIARKFNSGVPSIDFANEIQKIASGDIKISEIGGIDNPFSMRQAVKQELGSGAKYDQLQVELGKLAEEEARGSASAARASRVVNTMFDYMNSIFYNAILSYNPRFHGRNLISAPSIIHMTTGIGLNPIDMLEAARIMDPFVSNEHAYAYGEASVQNIANDVIVTDRLGNKFTAGDLYKKAVESGVLKSAASAAIDSRFLDEAAKLGIGSTWFKGSLKQTLAYPAHMANAEDNLWRLATIVHAIKGGDTLEGALVLGRRSLFDFGAATQFERQYVARKVLFYNYFRNSVIQGVRTLLENPSRVLKQYRLVNDASKLMVGDQSWTDLTFYSPMDAGVISIATKYAPSAGKTGSMTVLPNMPYNDAAVILAGLLYQPSNFLLGQPDLVTGKRKFGSGFVYGKLSPTSQAIVRGLAGEQIMADVAMTKNQMSLNHVMLADSLESGSGGAIPAKAALLTMFNAHERDALPGENSYKGKVYDMKPDDFAAYKYWIAGTIASTGAKRLVDEWTAAYGSMMQNGMAGNKARSLSDVVGITSKYAVPTPAAQQAAALQKSTEALQQQTAIEEERARLARPKEPSAAQRIK